MKSLWNDNEAKTFDDDPLHLRVYTSRLLGQEPELVLHGGGNTSLKANVKNLFGDKEEILFVKGSGFDLATIQANEFAPVRLEVLIRMVTLDRLIDADMVRLTGTCRSSLWHAVYIGKTLIICVTFSSARCSS